MNNWYEFYKNRINSTYQQYFEKRYEPFLNMIKGENPEEIFEAGCGIGSVSKYIVDHTNIECCGIDLCPDMVSLANRNLNATDMFEKCNIFDYSTDTLTVTHGVLEHFSDEDIIRILKLYPNSIHYVPLDKYITPSFGDERLLSVEHWIRLVNPREYILFNNGYDLAFRI